MATDFAPRFAVVSDTHAAPWDQVRGAALARVFASIAAAHPDAVLHCGDLTEDGSLAQFAELTERIGAAIAPILHVVPGNHERRWDPTDGRAFQAWFGTGEFDVVQGGVRLLGLDPTQSLLEPGRFGADGLARLRARLADGTNAPTLLFLHFPVGVDNYFLDDQDRFLRVVDDYDVRAIFAGHIHTEQVHEFNGLTQVVCAPAGARPGYYWVEPVDSTTLAVSRVDVATNGTENRRPLTTIRLTGDGAGRAVRPVAVELGEVDAGRLPVTVQLPPAARVSGVRARVYPQHVFAARDDSGWADLAEPPAGESTAGGPAEQGWTGCLDVSTVVPGIHRATLRVGTVEGAAYDVTAEFAVPSDPDTTPAPAGEIRLDGAVQAGLAAHADLVVAATTNGEVVALRVGADRRLGPIPLWRTNLGPVRRAPAFTAAGDTIVVPCADDRLIALDARTGSIRWTVDTAAPFLSAPLIAAVGGRETVLGCAGGALWAVDAATGERLWRQPGHGIFAGRVGTDGVRVYAGGGDGSAHAYDAATGAEVWAFATNTRDDAYHRRIYGPWDGWVTVLPGGPVLPGGSVLPGGLVLVSTVVRAQALDPATGARVWAVHGNHIYAEAHPTDAGVLLLAESGELRLVDPTTGAVGLEVRTGLRVLNTGARITGRTAWVLGTSGRLLAVDLTNGQITAARQLGTAQSFSAPVIVGDVLVAADQAGWVRAFGIGPAG